MHNQRLACGMANNQTTKSANLLALASFQVRDQCSDGDGALLRREPVEGPDLGGAPDFRCCAKPQLQAPGNCKKHTSFGLHLNTLQESHQPGTLARAG